MIEVEVVDAVEAKVVDMVDAEVNDIADSTEPTEDTAADEPMESPTQDAVVNAEASETMVSISMRSRRCMLTNYARSRSRFPSHVRRSQRFTSKRRWSR